MTTKLYDVVALGELLIDFTQNGKFLLIKPSKESIFISTYNSEEKQKDNKKYFRSELESIIS